MSNQAGEGTTVPVNGYAIRWGRKNMGISTLGLASAIGRDRSYVAKLETGTITRVPPEVFQSLTEALVLEDRRAIMAWPHARQSA